MKEQQIAVSFRDKEGKTEMNFYDTAEAAREDILSKLNYDQKAKKDLAVLWTKKSGTLHISGNEISFKVNPGEYNTTDNQFFQTVESYFNAGRTDKSYKAMAERISQEMHRYIQNEFWKFIKEIMCAFAKGRYDIRNERAHNEAEACAQFMSKK